MSSHLIIYSIPIVNPRKQRWTQHFFGVRREIFLVDSLAVLAVSLLRASKPTQALLPVPFRPVPFDTSISPKNPSGSNLCPDPSPVCRGSSLRALHKPHPGSHSLLPSKKKNQIWTATTPAVPRAREKPLYWTNPMVCRREVLSWEEDTGAQQGFPSSGSTPSTCRMRTARVTGCHRGRTGLAAAATPAQTPQWLATASLLTLLQIMQATALHLKRNCQRNGE